MKGSVGVIGAGIMGRGVSFQFAKYQYPVVLVDVSKDILDKASVAIRDIHRHDVLMTKAGRSPLGLNDNPLSNISFSTKLADLSNVDLIIENIPEIYDLKAELYRGLRGIVRDDALLGINTSATPITKLASLLDHPENVMGLHFSNPVHLMPTVELVRGFSTSDNAIDNVKDILVSLNMTCVVVNDSPGFVTNRVMLLYINEAIYCVQEGVSSAADVDKIFRECLSHKLGPLETADLIGLDTILYSLEVLYDNFNDSKYRPCPLLRKMVNAGQFGQKTLSGFYKY